MKKSIVVLSAALLIPALVSLGGIAFGVRQVKPVAGNDGLQKDSLGHLFDRLKGPLSVVREEVVVVDGGLKISSTISQLEVSFDESLVGKARVRVESKTPLMTKVDLSPGAWSFAPNDDGEPVRVILALPTSFETLDIQVAGSRCEFDGSSPVKIKKLELSIRGSACQFALQNVLSQSFNMILEAANVDVKMESIEGQTFATKVNSGKLDWTVDSLKFSGAGSQSFKLQNVTGKSDIRIDSAPPHSLLARVKMGKLELVRGDSRENIAGMNEERSFNGPAGAPEIGVDVEMGKVDFTIGKVVGGP